MSDQPPLSPGSEPQSATTTHVRGWKKFPAELRLRILEILARESSGWGACASVCKEWQAILEKESFRRLKVGVENLEGMRAMVGARQAQLVRHVWLNIELVPYSCSFGHCQKLEGPSPSYDNQALIRQSIRKLCFVLSRWPVVEGADLTLELSMQSPSDKEHSFRNLYFGGEDDDWTFDPLSHQLAHSGVRRRTQKDRDDRHGWRQGRQYEAPKVGALYRIFGEYTPCRADPSKLSVPSVNAVTRFLVRRQCRKRFESRILEPLLEALPRLQSFIYEPWQTWFEEDEVSVDTGNASAIALYLPTTVKHISVFEETNENYLALVAAGHGHTTSSWVRKVPAIVNSAFAERSRDLEKLSVTFMVEGLDFFGACKPYWVWYNMKSLALTSRKLTEAESAETTLQLLSSAARAALSMPRLQTMVLWNAGEGEAFKFCYRATGADPSIGWRGTWHFAPPPSVIKDWQTVAEKYTGIELRVRAEPVISTPVKSLARAIELLDLPPEVVHPRSLWQMQREDETSWYNTS